MTKLHIDVRRLNNLISNKIQIELLTYFIDGWKIDDIRERFYAYYCQKLCKSNILQGDHISKLVHNNVLNWSMPPFIYIHVCQKSSENLKAMIGFKYMYDV